MLIYRLNLRRRTRILHLSLAQIPVFLYFHSTHGIKPIPQPLLNQPSRQLQPNDPLPKTQHLSIITQHRSLHTKAIMCSHGTNTSDLVRGDRDAESGAADQERAVCFP
jgi:hypothetical protein